MVGFVLAEKLGWNDDGTALYKNATITTISCLGIALGSFVGTFFTETQKMMSLQHGMILFNILAIGANLLKQIESFETILIGRLIFGIICGI